MSIKNNNINSSDEINLDLDDYFIGIPSYTNDTKNINIDDKNMVQLFDLVLNNKFDEFKIEISNNKQFINKMTRRGIYLLHYSCYKKKHNFASYLLYLGANPNNFDIFGKTSQHYAILSNDIDIINILVLYGSNFNIKDIDGNTPLHYAISQENELIINKLLDININPFIKNNKNFTAIEYSIPNKNILTIMKNYINNFVKNT